MNCFANEEAVRGRAACWDTPEMNNCSLWIRNTNRFWLSGDSTLKNVLGNHADSTKTQQIKPVKTCTHFSVMFYFCFCSAYFLLIFTATLEVQEVFLGKHCFTNCSDRKAVKSCFAFRANVKYLVNPNGLISHLLTTPWLFIIAVHPVLFFLHTAEQWSHFWEKATLVEVLFSWQVLSGKCDCVIEMSPLIFIAGKRRGRWESQGDGGGRRDEIGFWGVSFREWLSWGFGGRLFAPAVIQNMILQMEWQKYCSWAMCIHEFRSNQTISVWVECMSQLSHLEAAVAFTGDCCVQSGLNLLLINLLLDCGHNIWGNIFHHTVFSCRVQQCACVRVCVFFFP